MNELLAAALAGGGCTVLSVLITVLANRWCRSVKHVVIKRETTSAMIESASLCALRTTASSARQAAMRNVVSDPARANLLSEVVSATVTEIENTFECLLKSMCADALGVVAEKLAALPVRIRERLDEIGPPHAFGYKYMEMFASYHDCVCKLLIATMNTEWERGVHVAASCGVFLIDATMSMQGNTSLLNGVLDGFVFRGLMCEYGRGRDGRSALLEWAKRRSMIPHTIVAENKFSHHVRFECGVIDPQSAHCVFSTCDPPSLTPQEINLLLNGVDTCCSHKHASHVYCTRSIAYKGETTHSQKKLLFFTRSEASSCMDPDLLWTALSCNFHYILLADEELVVRCALRDPDTHATIDIVGERLPCEAAKYVRSLQAGVEVNTKLLLKGTIHHARVYRAGDFIVVILMSELALVTAI